MNDNAKHTIVYTDGGCIGNPGPGGWAAIFYDGNGNEPSSSISGSEEETTNNRMELVAVIRALEALPPQKPVRIFTDSQYVQLGITEWIVNWRKKGFRKVKNPDLWMQLDALAQGRDIDWQWVRGHADSRGNILADELANRCARETAARIKYFPRGNKDRRRIFLDTETTGFGAREHRIVALGAVSYIEREAVGGEIEYYFNPGRAVDPDAMRVHGLTDEFLAEYKPFSAHAKAIADFVRGAEVVMHNAEFDEEFINAEFKRAAMPPLAEIADVKCSLQLARRLHPQLGSHSLDALCSHFRVDRSARATHHNALADARILAQVYLRMTLEQMTFALPGARANVKPAAAIDEAAGGNVPVIKAGDDELAAHEALLDKMKQETKVEPLWRRK